MWQWMLAATKLPLSYTRTSGAVDFNRWRLSRLYALICLALSRRFEETMKPLVGTIKAVAFEQKNVIIPLNLPRVTNNYDAKLPPSPTSRSPRFICSGA